MQTRAIFQNWYLGIILAYYYFPLRMRPKMQFSCKARARNLNNSAKRFFFSLPRIRTAWHRRCLSIGDAERHYGYRENGYNRASSQQNDRGTRREAIRREIKDRADRDEGECLFVQKLRSLNVSRDVAFRTSV